MEKIFYEVKFYEGGNVSGLNGESSFKTPQEAIEVAVDHKNNPRMFNRNMTDSNVEYWKKQTYTVIKKTVTEEVVSII